MNRSLFGFLKSILECYREVIRRLANDVLEHSKPDFVRADKDVNLLGPCNPEVDLSISVIQTNGSYILLKTLGERHDDWRTMS